MSMSEAIAARERSRKPALPIAVRLAWRELRGGLSGFYVFIACIALGVMVITGVGALSDGLGAGFERQGETILGGDVTLARMHKRAEPAERAWMAQRGRVSETATMRAMARRLDGSDQALAEIKGVDDAYPLVGQVKIKAGEALESALRSGGAVVDPILLERLGLKIGDRLSIGTAEIPVRATLEAEPDSIADRLTFGPRVFLTHETMQRTGLVQPGSLIRWRYAVKLDPGAFGEGAGALRRFRDAVKADLPESGFTLADRRDPSPQVTRTLDRLRQFLTLIGLTALLVGGVGVANAVATFIDRRRKVIATFKSIGATGRLTLGVFLTQVMLIAAIGVAIGVALGMAVPGLIDWVVGDSLPIRAEFRVGAGTVLSAALYGFLVALVFTLWPLGRAELIRAGVLFREEVAPEGVWPRKPVILTTLAAVGALAGFAIWTSDAHVIAAWFCGGLAVVFALFIGIGEGVTRLARRVPRPRIPELALAIGNLGAPGGLTRSVVLSLGAGLSLLVAVALADHSLVKELTSRVPANSPNYFLLDIPKADMEPLAELVRREVPGTEVSAAPMLRGRLVRLGDRPVETIKVAPEAQWVLTGDRGLTYSERIPEGSRIVMGDWWAAGYSGEPLVSFEQELAKRLGVGVGDTVTVNVLGRNVTARIANLREVKWESLAINFVMVFSPNTLKAAPHNLLATATLPKDATLAQEADVARALAKAYPAVTAIRVKDAINQFNRVFGKLVIAVRVAGSVTLVAGALVLAGALATAQRRRIQQAVILKTLGATRRRILTSHVAEYLLLGTVTALFAVALGSIAAWVALTKVMEVELAFSWGAVGQALGLASGLVLAFGAIGTWRVLQARPVPYLRSE